jgi:hypothetical protein
MKYLTPIAKALGFRIEKAYSAYGNGYRLINLKHHTSYGALFDDLESVAHELAKIATRKMEG